MNQLRPISRFSQRRGDTIKINLPEDDVAWLALFRPISDLPLFEFQPKSPNNTPNKATFPIVEMHGHLTHLFA